MGIAIGMLFIAAVIEWQIIERLGGLDEYCHRSGGIMRALLGSCCVSHYVILFVKTYRLSEYVVTIPPVDLLYSCIDDLLMILLLECQ